MHILSAIPIAVDRTRLSVTMYFAPPDSAGARLNQEYVSTFVRDVIAEDFGMLKHLQQGMLSGAKGSISFHTNELLCRHLADMTDKFVRG